MELVVASNAQAQCTVVDAAAPYFQDFESTDGNWVAGGTASDWVWGQPTKPTINGAAGGQNCWITGNLSGSAYNAGERSYIVSSCFDFTNLQYPYIEFNVFWETEYKYDGACFQYSLNNGASWVNVGSVSEPPNCLNSNWFNTASVNNLTGLGPNKEGWSGTTKSSSGPCSGGNGSGSWVLASHAMSILAGKPSVKFRFTFGSGTTCNAYDGFAIDNIKITNSPASNANFVTSCLISPMVAFTNTSSLCFGAFSWDFGDPASGIANTATSFNTTHNFSDPGSYTITLTATGGGGPAITVAKQVQVIGVQAAISQPISCSNSNNGAATAMVTADTGVSGITYSWNTSPVQTTSTISGLSPGTYIVTVSASNACAASDTITIMNPLPLTHNVAKTDATCGSANGGVIVNESGGTKPYTYNWSPGVSNGDTAINLQPGLYIVSINDNAGCTDSVHVQIINVGGVSVLISTKTDVNCFGGNTGSATAVASGAGGAFAYQWLPTGGSAATASNLPAGSYKVIVTDGSGCKDSAIVQINQPALSLAATISTTSTTCGLSNGTAKVIATGGVPNYTFQWMPGNYTTDSISNLSAGTYNVTVTDANGCVLTKQAVVIATPFLQIVSITPTHVACYGLQTGSAVAVVSGGTVPFTFTWTNGANSYTGNPLQNIAAGTYQLTVKDYSGCTVLQSVTISQPLQPLQHSVVINNISCTNTIGSANITESGGTPPYVYLWSPSGGTGSSASGLAVGNYVVNISDNNNCTDTVQIQILNTSTVSVSISNIVPVLCSGGRNGAATASAAGVAPFGFVWSPIGGNNATASNLAAGNYTVSVTDNTGCSSMATVQITEPLPISPLIITLPTTCGVSNGTAFASATGGTQPYIYKWFPGNLPGDTVKNLSATTYIVTIVDAKGCTTTGQAIIGPSTSPSANVIAVSTTCNTNNGRASVTVSNGTAPYSYLWMPGNYTTTNITNLSPGIYTVMVTDAKSCKNSISGFVKPSTTPIIRSISPVDALCSGKASGSASAVVTGGVLPYTYNWSNGVQTFTTSSLLNVGAGIYQLTVSDSASCADTKTTTISEPQPMQFAISTTPTSCGLKNALAWANVIGGTAPYTFVWSSGSIGDTATNLGGGGASVDVTDGNGCMQASGLIPIRASLPLQISLGKDTIICPGNKALLYPGDFASYRWQDNSVDSVFIATQTGNYTVSVVDSIGCIAKASIMVEANCRDIIFPDAFTPDSDKRNDEFGPLGTLSAVSDYSISIFNRWGQKVFDSTNPFRKWNGTVNGVSPGSGVYVWIASYSFDHRPKKTVKGTIVLIK